jgi:glycosyltransferase involved in cell wall biosynthesis
VNIRVAHIVSGLSVGGAERNLVSLLNSTTCDYRALIAIGRPPSGATFNRDLDPEIEQLVSPVRRRSLPIGVFRLARLLRIRRVNVVHTHMYESNLYGSLAAWVAGVPVIVTSEHGENPWKNRRHRWIERHVISRLAAVRFCVSPRILERRRDIDGVPASKLMLMANGTILPMVSRDDKARSPPVVGAVGRFIEAKDYPGLLKAVAVVRDRGFEFRVSLLGDGPQAAELKQLAEDLHLNSIVEFPGMVTDVGSWYPRFDVFVSSSIREGLPMVLLEAMAHRLPVVVTDVGACAEVVQHGLSGLVVPPGRPDLLADALGELLKNPDKRAALGSAARQRIEEHYSIGAVAAEHLQVYRSLLESNVSKS